MRYSILSASPFTPWMLLAGTPLSRARAAFTLALTRHRSPVILADSFNFTDSSLTEWQSLYHISSFIRHLKLPFGDHSLRASLSCAGSAVADSPVMTVKCNHLPPVFDEHEGQCRCTCARACILIRNWNLPSHGGRNTSTVTAWSADPFKSHQKILSAFIKLTKGTWLFLPWMPMFCVTLCPTMSHS